MNNYCKYQLEKIDYLVPFAGGLKIMIQLRIKKL
jgi:hypothetical protein